MPAPDMTITFLYILHASPLATSSNDCGWSLRHLTLVLLWLVDAVLAPPTNSSPIDRLYFVIPWILLKVRVDLLVFCLRPCASSKLNNRRALEPTLTVEEDEAIEVSLVPPLTVEKDEVSLVPPLTVEEDEVSLAPLLMDAEEERIGAAFVGIDPSLTVEDEIVDSGGCGLFLTGVLVSSSFESLSCPV